MPSRRGNWQTPLAVMPTAQFQGDLVRIRNIRNFRYRNEDDFTPDYYDRTINLNDVESVDFIVVPFSDAPTLAHTMLSFGFKDGAHLGVSVEARLEKGESYSPLLGAMKRFELMYILADERDIIPLRSMHRNVDVYVYSTLASKERVRALFVDVLQRTNQLSESPEFYDTLTNNCTTNIVRHINVLAPGRIPLDYRVLLPGLSDQLAYELGLLPTDAPFEVLKQRSLVNERVVQHLNSDDFSAAIRR